jgi:hypothetical protein
MPTFKEARDTIASRFTTEFHSRRSEPIGFDNLSRLVATDGSLVSKPTDSAWVHLRIQHGEGSQISSGKEQSRRFRQPGVASVQIYVPEGTGDGLAYRIADDVKASLRGQTVDHVRFRSQGMARGGPDGAWWLLTVNVQFDFDEIA